jgi:DNA-directed RNA polymerase subunit H (RpoH/RPB5)
MDDDLVNVLVYVKKNQVLMFQDRGFSLPPSEAAWLALDADAARASLRQLDERARGVALDALYTEPSTVWVYYSTATASFGVEDVEAMVAEATERRRPHQRVLLVCYTRPTSQAWEALSSYDVEVWTYAQLAANPTKHFLSQRHVALTPEEKRAFLSTSKIDPQCLPLIYASDPMVRWHGWRVGQILRIERSNLVSFSVVGSTFYRLVVPEPLSDHATKVTTRLP